MFSRGTLGRIFLPFLATAFVWVLVLLCLSWACRRPIPNCGLAGLRLLLHGRLICAIPPSHRVSWNLHFMFSHPPYLFSSADACSLLGAFVIDDLLSKSNIKCGELQLSIITITTSVVERKRIETMQIVNSFEEEQQLVVTSCADISYTSKMACAIVIKSSRCISVL